MNRPIVRCFKPHPPATGAWGGSTARAAVAAALLMLLSACGPGVGGTGIGNEPSTLATFGATSASLCASNLAGSLACPSVAVPPTSPNPADVGTATVTLVDGSNRVVVTLNGNRIELNAPCAGVKFSGEWGLVPGQAPRFYGSAESSAYTGAATLELTTSLAVFNLQVLDINGGVLVGPLTLRIKAAPQPVSC
jgi:hypothetical protein